MTDRIRALAVVVTALLATPAVARAQPTPPPEGDFRLRWPYPTFRPVEYVLGLGAPILFRIIDHNTFDADEPRWTESNFFDDGVESLIGDNGEDTRRWAATISDGAWYGAMAYPFVDTLLVPLILDGNPYVAWQMMAINVQSMALNGFITLLSIRASARSRPDHEQCTRRAEDPDDCPYADWKSFPSGHTSGAFTGAALVCAHHQALPLYGGGTWDTVACVGALTMAMGTAVTRVVADRHHAVDVVTGAAIGLASGWLLPWLLHYRFDWDEVRSEQRKGEVTLLPWSDGRAALGVGATGLW